jgi:hypothetical protein
MTILLLAFAILLSACSQSQVGKVDNRAETEVKAWLKKIKLLQ